MCGFHKIAGRDVLMVTPAVLTIRALSARISGGLLTAPGDLAEYARMRRLSGGEAGR
jgi:hypothetical protein